MGVVLEQHYKERQETKTNGRNTELIEAGVVRDIEGRVELKLCGCGLYRWLQINP